MKPIFKILLCFWVVFTLSVFIPIFLLAQKPPHLDSLIFLPDNELMPIDPNPTPEFSPEYRYPDFGFEINPTSSEYRSKEDIWRNAPIIVEGRTMKGMLQEERNKYPALFLSNKEVYEVYPYALSYVYRGDVIGDTIYILLPRYNYNKVQAPDPNGHDCKAFVYAPNLYSIAFLKPIEIDGYTYYSPCNTNYEGFEWVNELAKFIEDRCFVQAYSKNDILQTFSEKGDPLQVKRSIAEERKQKEAERKKHISPKKSDAIPVTGQKIEEYIRDKGWLRTVRQNIKLRGNDDFIYSIGDMEFYASGMDQYDLEFKVYGTAEQNRNFGAALLFLEYNSDVFGDSIMAHAKLSVFKAPAFAGSNYSLLSADDSDNVFGVSLVFTDFINNLGLLLPAGSKVHLYTVYITFSRSGCNNKPDFKPSEWDRVNFITHYMHPIDSSFTNYDTVTIEPIPNPTLCPYPQITTSFKNIVGKRAGVGDTLEIKGINFGTTGGYVAFKDANFGSGLYTKGLESQYLLSWTDTLIKVLIPSYTTKNYPSGTRGCAGSGLVKVYTMNGDSAISSDLST